MCRPADDIRTPRCPPHGVWRAASYVSACVGPDFRVFALSRKRLEQCCVLGYMGDRARRNPLTVGRRLSFYFTPLTTYLTTTPSYLRHDRGVERGTYARPRTRAQRAPGNPRRRRAGLPRRWTHSDSWPTRQPTHSTSAACAPQAPSPSSIVGPRIGRAADSKSLHDGSPWIDTASVPPPGRSPAAGSPAAPSLGLLLRLGRVQHNRCDDRRNAKGHAWRGQRARDDAADDRRRNDGGRLGVGVQDVIGIPGQQV